MIRSIGLDIVETQRIADDIERFGERFVDRILGAEEKEIYNNRKDKMQFLSGRFAAKEAVIKGLGRFVKERPLFTKLLILPDENGMPALKLPDELKSKLSHITCMLSITHEKKYAAAVAVFSEDV